MGKYITGKIDGMIEFFNSLDFKSSVRDTQRSEVMENSSYYN